jgi:NitT/TauT family transport system permease protein
MRLSHARSIFDQIWPRALAIFLLIAAWWAVAESGLFSSAILPPPNDVWSAFVSNLTRQGRPGHESILAAAYASILRLMIGIAVAIVLGTLIGLAMAASKVVQRSIGGLMTGLQALPSISWLPLAILWFGLSQQAVMFVVIIGAIPAMSLATSAAVRLVPPLYIRAGRTLGASGWTLYRKVVLPAAVPGYIGGLQQAWALAWRALMAGELIATGAKGLGQLLEVSQQQFRTDMVLAVMLMIIIIGMFVDGALSVVDRRVRSSRGLLMEG